MLTDDNEYEGFLCFRNAALREEEEEATTGVYSKYAEYGIEHQLEEYHGVRYYSKKQLSAPKLKDIKQNTFIIIRGEDNGDAFYVAGSEVALWLAYVVKLQDADDKGKRNVTVNWFVPLKTSKKDGRFPSSATFMRMKDSKKCCLEESLDLEDDNLILINIKDLSSKKNQREGKLGKRIENKLSELLVKTDEQKTRDVCPLCKHAPQSGDTIRCTECGQSSHVACAGIQSFSDDWVCDACLCA